VTPATRAPRRKEVSSMSRGFSCALALVAAVCVVALAGCGKSQSGAAFGNLRPSIEISDSPITGDSTFYSVRINWFASDPDGQVTRYIYAVDPPVMGDTTWTTTNSSEVSLFFRAPNPTDPLPPADRIVVAFGYHTFVLKAIDNEGLASAYVTRSFTSRTTAPSTVINRPSPTRQQPITTTPSVTIEWTGSDPDGVLSQKPIKYKFRLVPADDIDPTNPEGITTQLVQDFFGADAANFFANWDSVGGDTTSKFYEGLTPQTRYYFAIVAFDEAGAFEPRFNLDTNVLQFRPTLNKLGPDITVFNEFFSRTQTTGGISLAASRIYPLEFPADSRIVFNWFATPDVGAVITGYRWALDIEGQDIGNETARVDDNDIHHWSSWSLNEVQAGVGPFVGSLDSTISHFFYLEARDNLGFISLFTIKIVVVKPSFARELLVIDDMYGTPTDRPARFVGAYPMEAEQDSFYYAVGGVPDSLYIKQNPPILDKFSEPGCFAGFDYDTLDYKFSPDEGLKLEQMSKYKVIAIYSDQTSSSRSGQKFGSNLPATALRFINSVNRLNTLAVYLRQGGKAWLFGDGTTTCIANGYWSRVAGVPRLPYTSGEDFRTNVLFPGDFLYDFCHIRSELNVTGDGAGSFTNNQQLRGCIPYLPEFACPPGTTTRPLDLSCDPRIGPSAEKTAVRWSGLPRLTLAAYRGSNPVFDLRAVRNTYVITKPLFNVEGSGASFGSVMDTLYLSQCRLFDPGHLQIPPADGFPNAVHYYGTDHGQVVWFGFPLYYFELSQARQVTAKVLTVLGLTPLPAGVRSGPHAVAPETTARRSGPIARNENNDTRRASR
jgi:hypothetical protein